MKVRVLGCSGGIGAPAATTSFLIDDDILIDAGTGLGALSLAELARIDHVFLTHSHLDHINSLPLMADSVGMMRDKPIVVYALAETMETLRDHVMNGRVWPDFTVIPTPENPFLVLQEMAAGETRQIGTRAITSIAVNHTIPAVGYVIDSGSGSLAFSGDTTVMDAFWDELNALEELRYLFVETTFTDENIELAKISKHLCPSMLAGELAKLDVDAEIYISHLMPGSEQEIMAEIAKHIPERTPRALTRDQVFEL
ncbi:MAG: 3',5'-cyclic-nucleotide phosphodiesterase [Acidiferrobacterales bacterium]|nr:3',5'-cyclic-nucleotide phosphodiesterase [Acidiferrobacterales bacterium]